MNLISWLSEISQKILGTEDPWLVLVDPSHFSLEISNCICDPVVACNEFFYHDKESGSSKMQRSSLQLSDDWAEFMSLFDKNQSFNEIQDQTNTIKLDNWQKLWDVSWFLSNQSEELVESENKLDFLRNHFQLNIIKSPNECIEPTPVYNKSGSIRK